MTTIHLRLFFSLHLLPQILVLLLLSLYTNFHEQIEMNIFGSQNREDCL